jgi:3'-phosphoadenosine 5'-phosphosulfate (PAPS) 3'-phosphatase
LPQPFITAEADPAKSPAISSGMTQETGTVSSSPPKARQLNATQARGSWEFSLKPWDMAAGTLLVREAGGLVTDMRGGAFHLGSPHVLADNGLVHAETVELFDEIFGGRYRTPLPEIGP